MADIGHNSTPEELTQFLERIEQIEGEIKDHQDDRKEVYAEAKGRGFDVKALRKLVALRKQDPEKRAADQAVLETYASAIGMEIFG